MSCTGKQKMFSGVFIFIYMVTFSFFKSCSAFLTLGKLKVITLEFTKWERPPQVYM